MPTRPHRARRRSVELPPAVAPSKPPPILGADLHPLEAARRLLWQPYQTVLANLDGAIQGTSAEPLHDIRVAIRRLRSLLQAFRKELPPKVSRPIDQAWRRLGKDLSPARDLDVWLEMLQSDAARAVAAQSRGWGPFLQHHLQARRRLDATVERCLRGPGFTALRRGMTQLLEADLPKLEKTPADLALEQIAAKEIRKAWRRVLKRADLRCATAPGELHRFRIRLRRLRYLGEFFSDVLGPPMDKFTRRVHRLEQTLGRIHDTDMAFVHMARGGPPPPRRLVEWLRQRREKERREIDRAWRRLNKRGLQRALQGLLEDVSDCLPRITGRS